MYIHTHTYLHSYVQIGKNKHNEDAHDTPQCAQYGTYICIYYYVQKCMKEKASTTRTPTRYPLRTQ